MEENIEWRNWFKQQFGEIRDSFIVAEGSGKLILTLFKYHKFGECVAGFLIDIYFNTESNEFHAAGATFSKNSSVLYISKSSIEFNYNFNSKSTIGTIDFDGVQNKLSESISGFIQYQIEAGVFTLKNMNIDILFHDYREKAYLKVASWGMQSYYSNEIDNVLCVNCFGEGGAKGMSISKQDYESGLTGYALYSSNRINGEYGCSKCGGEGAKYEDWYLKENPELEDTPSLFKKGRGAHSFKYTFPEVELKG